jgi:enolase
LIDTYPIYSIEDGLSEVDWTNWAELKDELGMRVKIVGDDLFATNPQRIWTGIENDVATTVLIKPNQIGTVTETLQAITLCKENEWDVIVSHRSGETNDTFIADLAVGVSASHIKAGGCSRGERMAKYNRLLQIERELLSGQIQH